MLLAAIQYIHFLLKIQAHGPSINNEPVDVSCDGGTVKTVPRVVRAISVI